jgi:hypothetical protein
MLVKRLNKDLEKLPNLAKPYLLGPLVGIEET